MKKKSRSPRATRVKKPRLNYPPRGYELVLNVERFQYTLIFEFIRRTAGAPDQKLTSFLGSVDLARNSDKTHELQVSCNSMPGYGVNDISMLASPVAVAANNYGVSVFFEVEGLRKNDIFRVRSMPPQLQKRRGSTRRANLNGAARVYLRDPKLGFNAAPLVKIETGGVLTTWMEFPLRSIS